MKARDWDLIKIEVEAWFKELMEEMQMEWVGERDWMMEEQGGSEEIHGEKGRHVVHGRQPTEYQG